MIISKLKIYTIGVFISIPAFANTWRSFGPSGVNIKAAQKLEFSTVAYYDDPPKKEYGHVNSMVVYKDELYVGGLFDQAGDLKVENLAKWDGKKWSSAGGSIDGPVFSMIVYDDELYIAGNFKKIGNANIKNLAKWDGKKWSSVDESFEGYISAFVVFEKELLMVGSIFKAGKFKNENGIKIIKWNKKNWVNFASEVPNEPMAVVVYKNELYVGGTFLDAASKDDNLYKWNGKKWQGVAAFDGAVAKMLATPNDLYVSGYFSHLYKDEKVTGVVKFDGKKWSSVGDGLVHPQPRSPDFVHSLTLYNSNLLAGAIIPTYNELDFEGSAIWDGKKWNKFASGIDGSIHCFVEYKGELYAGGRFITKDSIDLDKFQYFNVAKLDKK